MVFYELNQRWESTVCPLERIQSQKAGTEHAFSMTYSYGSDTAMPISISLMKNDFQTIKLKRVSEDCYKLDDIYKFVRQRFGLPRGTFEYYGQTAGQACEEMRLLLSKPRRRTWTPDERAKVLEASGGDCAVCGATLTGGSFQFDHVMPLFEGGKDTMSTLQALCETCHSQKSEHERLSGLSHKSLFSELSQDVLEGLVDGVRIDTALLEFPSKHRACESLTAMPGFHPQARESYVIDEPDLLEAV